MYHLWPTLFMLGIFTVSSCAEVSMGLQDAPSSNYSADDSDNETSFDDDSDSHTSFDGDTDSGSISDNDTETQMTSDTKTAVDSDTESDAPPDTNTSANPDTDTSEPDDSESDTSSCGLALNSYTADFEKNNGGFVTTPTNGIWIWGQISGNVPTLNHGKVWATGLDEGWYGNCDNAFLTSPESDLSSCVGKSLTLSFDIYYHYHYLDGEGYRDGLLVELFDGTSWVQIAPDQGDWDTNSINASNCGIVPYIDNKPAFAGKISSWTRKSFTASFANYSQFKFRFVHGSDNSYPVYGAYIDNVQVTGK